MSLLFLSFSLFCRFLFLSFRSGSTMIQLFFDSAIICLSVGCAVTRQLSLDVPQLNGLDAKLAPRVVPRVGIEDHTSHLNLEENILMFIKMVLACTDNFLLAYSLAKTFPGIHLLTYHPPTQCSTYYTHPLYLISAGGEPLQCTLCCGVLHPL